jgi:hypothetical protein
VNRHAFAEFVGESVSSLLTSQKVLMDELLPKPNSGEVRVGDAARFVGAAT